MLQDLLLSDSLGSYKAVPSVLDFYGSFFEFFSSSSLYSCTLVSSSSLFTGNAASFGGGLYKTHAAILNRMEITLQAAPK